MQGLWIAHDAWILVGDGRKALMLRNAGTPQRPSFQVLRVLQDERNPHTSEHGTERPGRVKNHGAAASRHALDQTDWHEIAEERFAASVAASLNAAARERQFEQLVLVAPPAALASLRKELDAHAQSRIVAEVPKDLTKHPVPEIARVLTGS
jgi:protein required for attachment to host cells